VKKAEFEKNLDSREKQNNLENSKADCVWFMTTDVPRSEEIESPNGNQPILTHLAYTLAEFGATKLSKYSTEEVHVILRGHLLST